MSDLDSLLSQLFGKEDACAGENIDGTAWSRLVESDLTRVGIEDSLGGAGGDWSDAATVTIRAAQAGIAAPLTECLFIASHLAAKTGNTLPPGLVTASVAARRTSTLTKTTRGWHLTAAFEKVPWGSVCDELWALVPTTSGKVAFVRVNRKDLVATPRLSLGTEPRDDLHVDTEIGVHNVMDEDVIDEVMLLGALGRSCQLLGALRSCLRLSHEYVLVRHQFRKPLAAHQIVQHTIATIAEDAAAAESAVIAAVQQLPAPGRSPAAPAVLAIAAAKVQTSTAATKVARAAHQLHGAMGLTAEHPLHFHSTRLWSWRDEFGTEAHWSAQIADLVRTTYAGDVWAALTVLSSGAALGGLAAAATSNLSKG
ncbi:MULTISPECIES: acyl-CoA dehydrogenase family protein [Rhodococcus]|nr:MULTISPECIES: acyl-CoA dehydrogenase family protein [Rhodococcus]QQZ14630.1 hypothetical protein GO592_34475 [Rhodococcus sp. 21391]